MIKWIIKDFKKRVFNERGDTGGKTVIQQAPTTPAPSPSETSEQAFQAQLKYNPQLYEQYAKSYGQYLPQIAGTEFALQQQYAPQMQALQRQLYPEQSRLVEALSSQALQRMSSPFGYSADEQAALDAIRQRQRGQIARNIQTSANIGGGLYGGRRELREERALGELEQAFGQEDINRRLMASQQALQYASPVMQIQYPWLQQPQMPNYWQQTTPSADTLYNAMFQAGQPQQFGYQTQPHPLWGIAGQAAGGAAAGLMMSSLRYKKNIKLWGKPSNYSSN